MHLSLSKTNTCLFHYVFSSKRYTNGFKPSFDEMFVFSKALLASEWPQKVGK